MGNSEFPSFRQDYESDEALIGILDQVRETFDYDFLAAAIYIVLEVNHRISKVIVRDYMDMDVEPYINHIVSVDEIERAMKKMERYFELYDLFIILGTDAVVRRQYDNKPHTALAHLRDAQSTGVLSVFTHYRHPKVIYMLIAAARSCIQQLTDTDRTEPSRQLFARSWGLDSSRALRHPHDPYVEKTIIERIKSETFWQVETSIELHLIAASQKLDK